jgi:D-3-phosphoglycerate dehydrogenase
MKVLVSDNLANEAIEKLKSTEGLDIEVKTGMSPDELKETIKGKDAIIVRSATKLTKDVLESADNLKVIARAGVGLDNVDVETAKAKGIEVVNTPGGTSIGVAELAMALMLTAARHIARADATMKKGLWEKKKLGGIELYGKTLGVIGLGRIGSKVAERAQAFEMKIVAYDPYLKDSRYPMVSLDELLSMSDYVSIHIPATPETKNLLSKEQLSKMKDGAVLVNTARGGIVDEAALYEVLSAGKLRYAAFDVYGTEPPFPNKLIELDNFIATPHLGASTKEGQTRVGVQAAEKVIKILKEAGR